MGFSSSKRSTKPIYSSQITGAADTINNAYRTNQPAIQNIADQVQGLVPDLIAKYKAGNPAVTAAEGYVGDVLGGKYLDAGNPYLQGMIDQTDNSVQDRVNAIFSRAGQTGSSRQVGELGARLAEAENSLRYGDYNSERARMGEAAGLAPGLAAGEAVSIMPALSAAQAGTSIPLDAAGKTASTIGALLGPYTKTKQSPGLGAILGGIAGAGLSGWASGGFG